MDNIIHNEQFIARIFDEFARQMLEYHEEFTITSQTEYTVTGVPKKNRQTTICYSSETFYYCCVCQTKIEDKHEAKIHIREEWYKYQEMTEPYELP